MRELHLCYVHNEHVTTWVLIRERDSVINGKPTIRSKTRTLSPQGAKRAWFRLHRFARKARASSRSPLWGITYWDNTIGVSVKRQTYGR